LKYRLYYWPQIQGRGEFIRLALEYAGAAYEDVLRRPKGFSSQQKLLGNPSLKQLPFANILDYLGRRLRLAPRGEAGGETPRGGLHGGEAAEIYGLF